MTILIASDVALPPMLLFFRWKKSNNIKKTKLGLTGKSWLLRFMRKYITKPIPLLLRSA